MTLKVGDIVELRPDSSWASSGSTPSNPLGIQGTVTSVSTHFSDALGIRVDWANGMVNSYRFTDLTLISSPKDKEAAQGKLKYKKYADDHGDSFKVDCKYSTQHVSFEPNQGEIVVINALAVKRLRKQLKNWLDANGYND